MKGRSYILNPTHYGKRVSYNITQRNCQISTQILNLSFTAEATHIPLLENNLNREIAMIDAQKMVKNMFFPFQVF